MPKIRKNKKRVKNIKRVKKEKVERKESEKQNNINVSVNSSGSGGSGGSNTAGQQMPSSFYPHIGDIKNSLLEVLKGYVMKNEPKQPTNMGSDENDMMEMKNLDRFIQDPPVIFQNSPSPFAPPVPIASLEDLAKNNYLPLDAEQPEDYEREFREEEEEKKPKSNRGRKRVIRTPEEEAQHKQDKKENSRLKRERKKEEKLKRERDYINNL